MVLSISIKHQGNVVWLIINRPKSQKIIVSPLYTAIEPGYQRLTDAQKS